MANKKRFSGEISVQLQLDNAFHKEMKIMATFEKLVQEEKFELVYELAHYCIDKNITPYLTWCSLDWLFLYIYEKFLDLDDENDPDEELRNNYWEEIIDYLWDLKGTLPFIPENLHSALVIEEFMDKMKLYYESWGLSLKMYYKTYMLVYLSMGNKSQAKEYFQLWQETEDDFMSDCEACELTEQVRYFNFMGEYERAIETAQPLLAGEVTCTEVPATTYASVLQSLVSLGRYEQARELIDEAIEQIEGLENNHAKYAELTSFLLVLAELKETEKIDHLAMKYWDKIIMEATNVSILKLHISVCNNGPEYFRAALDVAKDYDKRNKNHYFQDLLYKIKEE